MSDIGYIGPLGGLAQIPCAPLTSMTASRPHTEWESTEGNISVQVGPKTRRQWAVDWEAATPEMIANLAAMFQGEYGYGPFWFVDPGAQATNVASAEASMMSHIPTGSTIAGGPITLADGQRAGRSLTVASQSEIVGLPRIGAELHRVPVIYGEPVCGYVYAAGPGTVQIRLSWWDAANNSVSNTSYANWTPGSAIPRNIYRVAFPPANAASVSIGVTGATRLARPGISWTSQPPWWTPGQGADSVMAPMELSQALLLAATTGSPRALFQMGTTIKEIG